MILAGAIPACILALLIDFIVGKLESTLSYTNKQKSSSRFGKTTKKLMISFASILLIIAGAFTVYSKATAEEKIVIGSKKFQRTIDFREHVCRLN
jgi:osmoprotectant transport system permease protein